jgi:hypothetical protein
METEKRKNEINIVKMSIALKIILFEVVDESALPFILS